MRTTYVQTCAALAVGGALVALSTVASAETTPTATEPAPSGLNTPPAGPGTERQEPGRPGVREGLEGGVGLGTGFSSTYGIGMEARLGYTFRQGIYAGGTVQYYAGTSINNQSNHATFVGGELGYKVFTSKRFEIRPYVFLGPSFITQVQNNPFFSDSNTSFAVQPSVLLMYHFGQAFLGADARWLVTPTPATFALFASGGIGF
jgi:outer membrane protein with beta-barrel domain